MVKIRAVRLHINAKIRIIEIYNYCRDNWGTRVAIKKKAELMHTISLLRANPYMGCIESSIEESRYSYRSFTEGYNKIIYREQENGDILVMNLFDTRQNPDKLTTITE